MSDAGQPDIGRISALSQDRPAIGDITWLRGSASCATPAIAALVLEVATRVVFPLIMVLSAYFFFARHNTPGGGFAAGWHGLALVFHYLAERPGTNWPNTSMDAGKLLGAGLTLSAGAAVASLLLGTTVLSSAVVQFDLPVFGHVKLVAALFFDLGVYLIVVGLVLDVLRSLGARVDVELLPQPPVVR